MNPGDSLIQIVCSSCYAIDIGQHIFSIEKYQHICDRLVAAAHPRLISSVEPQVASLDQLVQAHTGSYLEKVHTLTLSPAEIAGLELPLTEAVVGGFKLMTGGTVTASSLALADGIAAHIAGGFHHAFANHGEGFCLFNDVAVAIQVLRREGAVSRTAVVDLYVHNGNGTAMI